MCGYSLRKVRKGHRQTSWSLLNGQVSATLISVGRVLFLSNVKVFFSQHCTHTPGVFFLFPGAETTMKWSTIMTGVWDYKSGVVGQVV